MKTKEKEREKEKEKDSGKLRPVSVEKKVETGKEKEKYSKFKK